MTITDVSVRLYRRDGYNLDDDAYPKRWTLTVKDEASGVPFLTLHLTDVQYAEMHSSMEPSDIAAELASAHVLAVVVGKHRWNVSLNFGRSWDPDNYTSTPRGMETRLRNLVQDADLDKELGADHWDVGSRNFGYTLTFIGYSDTPATAAADAARARTRLDEVAASGAWTTLGDASAYPTTQSINDESARTARREGRV